jgi:hypothetical protein
MLSMADTTANLVPRRKVTPPGDDGMLRAARL